jgi:hypothetical protein
VHKAIGRHRRYDKPDTMAASEKVDDELEGDDDNNDDGGGGGGAVVGEEDRMEADRPISIHLKSRSALSTAEKGKQGNRRRRSVNNQPLMLDELLHSKISAKKYKVMAKSIVLAREDMIAIENNDDVTVDNNNSSSSSNRRKGVVVSSAATNSETVAPSMKIWPLNLTRWWLEMGRHIPKGSSSVVVPTTSAHNINMAVLALRSVSNTTSDLESLNDINSSNSTTAEDRSKTARFYDQASSSSSSTNVKSMSRGNSNGGVDTGGIKEDDNDDDKLSKKSKLGHLSWYYSPVSVCERCSKVYAELDRLRNMKNKYLVQKQKELLDLEDEKNNRWKEVEVRLTP